MNLASIAKHYATHYRANAREEMRYYNRQPSLRAAIETAALSCLPNGKRHGHQRRIPGRVLAIAARALQGGAPGLGKAASFDDLHQAVEAAILPLRGIGELAVYDIAHRIGAYRGLEPELVYLHAGTRAGAKILGLSGKKLARRDLPAAFRGLSPAEIEDCLCIYKSWLRGGGRTTRACFSQPYCA